MMNLQDIDLLNNAWSKVISVQTQLLERISTLDWIERNFARPKNLPVFLWNLGARQFKQVKSSGNKCYIESLSICKLSPQDNCLDVLETIINYPQAGVFIVENLQPLLVLPDTANTASRERAQQIVSQLVNTTYALGSSSSQKYLLLLSTEDVELPLRLQEIIPQVRKELPNYNEICIFLSALIPTFPCKQVLDFHIDINALAVAASGLTLEEIRIGLQLGLLRKREPEKLLAQFLLDYKIQRLKAYGLQFVNQPQVADFGGLDVLKTYIEEVKWDYSEEARRRKVSLPKGILLVGPPGTGKTLSAHVIAKQLGFPLIFVDAGAISAGGAVFLRRLIERVEAAAPAVCYFDEFDKLFTISSTSEDINSSSSRAVLGTMLTWLQEKSSCVYVVATLNRLQALPPELTRIGRFDELFYVGFPQAIERKQIIALHASRFDERYQHGDGPLSQAEWKILLNHTVNCTGSELAKMVEMANSKIVREQMRHTQEFKSQGKPVPRELDLVQIGLEQLLEQRQMITPLYLRDTDRIIALENESRYVCKPASSQDTSEYAPPVQSFWGDKSGDSSISNSKI